MFNNVCPSQEFVVENKFLEKVKDIYLGQLQSFNGNIDKEVARIVKLSWSSFGRLNLVQV